MKSKVTASAITAPSARSGRNSLRRLWTGPPQKNTRRIGPPLPPFPKPPSSIKKVAQTARPKRRGFHRLLPACACPNFQECSCWTISRVSHNFVEVQQGEGVVDRNSKSNILRGVVASGKETIELDGSHAAVYSHVAVPSIYIKLDNDSDQAPPAGETASDKPSLPSLDAPRAEPQQPEQAAAAERFRIVRLKVKNGKRIVGEMKRASTGKVSQEEDSLKSTTDHVGTGWLKLTPTQDLAPGEYAVVEMKGDQGMNLFIWPFSVNPNGPANANPWTPDVKAKSAEPTSPK